MAVFASDGAAFLAGAVGEVFERTGGTWLPVAAGLDGAAVRGLLVETDAEGRWAVAGTDRGVFTTRPGVLVGSDSAPTASASPGLRAAPNPARGAVTFTLAGVETRTVEVVDVLGRLVARLEASSGGAIRWDASRVPAGVYLARTPDGAASARVTVVR